MENINQAPRQQYQPNKRWWRRYPPTLYISTPPIYPTTNSNYQLRPSEGNVEGHQVPRTASTGEDRPHRQQLETAPEREEGECPPLEFRNRGERANVATRAEDARTPPLDWSIGTAAEREQSATSTTGGNNDGKEKKKKKKKPRWRQGDANRDGKWRKTTPRLAHCAWIGAVVYDRMHLQKERVEEQKTLQVWYQRGLAMGLMAPSNPRFQKLREKLLQLGLEAIQPHVGIAC